MSPGRLPAHQHTARFGSGDALVPFGEAYNTVPETGGAMQFGPRPGWSPRDRASFPVNTVPEENETATASNNLHQTFPSLIPADPMHRQGSKHRQKRGTPQQQQQLPLARSEALAPRPAGEAGGDVTMRDSLRDLEDVEHSCVILARRIQYLGFSASTQLEGHFKTFGTVQCVVVPQSHVKPTKTPSEAGSSSDQPAPAGRQRPANLAFVIMESAAGAEAVLAAGTEHTIGGAKIVLEPFDGTRWKLQKEKLQKEAVRTKQGPPPDQEDGGSDGWKHHGAALDC